MEDMIEDLKTVLEGTQKDEEGGIAEGRGLISPISALGGDSESSLLRHLPFESEIRCSCLEKEESEKTVAHVAEEKGQISPMNAQTEGSESSLLRNFQVESKAVLSRLMKEASENAVAPLIERQNRLSDMCEVIRTQGDESRAVLDFIKDMMKALRAERFDIPKLACLLSPWNFEKQQGLSPEEQDRRTWIAKVQDDSGRKKGWFTKEMRLFLVCAETYRLVPCGSDGHGYQITEVRDWVKRAVGVLRLMVELTSVTLGVGAAVGLNSNVLEAIGDIGGIVDDEDLLRLKERENSYRQIEQRQAVEPEDVVTPLQGKAYDSLKDFIHEQEDEAVAEMVKGARKARRRGRDPPDTSRFVFFETVMEKDQEDGGSGEVKWVLRN